MQDALPTLQSSVLDRLPRLDLAALPAHLAVVIPVFREAPNVEPMIDKLRACLAGISWEAIFVDDDSPDGTSRIARRLAQVDPRVRCIRRVGRRGLASACIEGMLATSAPFVAVIDGDLQHDETILPTMLRAVEQGADLAIGSRHVAGGEATEGFSAARGSLSDAGARLARLLLPGPVADPMSGFFLLRRDLVEELAPRLTASGFKILLDILIAAGRPLALVEVPYSFRRRVAGESKLDIAELLAFAGLLVDKATHGLVPLRFLVFAVVGALGVLVHMLALTFAVGLLELEFAPAQWLATLVAMTANFWLNNRFTFRDARLRGARLWRGLVLFYLVCGIGAAANVGIADLLIHGGGWGWTLAGAAGALLTSVWNFVMSSTLVWRTR